jgi:hypothetical protein
MSQRTRRAVGVIVLAVSTAGCSAGSPGTSSATRAASPGPSSGSVTKRDFSGLVDIGGGRHLFAICEGTRKPTILLEAGDESDTARTPQTFLRAFPARVPVRSRSTDPAGSAVGCAGYSRREHAASTVPGALARRASPDRRVQFGPGNDRLVPGAASSVDTSAGPCSGRRGAGGLWRGHGLGSFGDEGRAAPCPVPATG